MPTSNSLLSSIKSSNSLSSSDIEILSYSTLASITLFSVIFSAYKFQKNFATYNNRTSNVYIILALISIVVLILISSIMYDILTYPHKDSISDKSEWVLIALSFINFMFYFVLPFTGFYLLEEKRYNEENNTTYETTANTNNQNDEDYDSDNNNHNNHSDSNNNLNSIIIEDFNWFNILKNYFYYITIVCVLNVIYIISYNLATNNTNRNINRYSHLLNIILNLSKLNSTYEILTYANFEVLLLIGKILSLIYLPYGIAKIISNIIESFKDPWAMKKEFDKLDENFKINYETIRQITSEKLMTGKPLSRKEKQILKECKTKSKILEHKQVVLDEKASTIQIILDILAYPVKFIFIFYYCCFNPKSYTFQRRDILQLYYKPYMRKRLRLYNIRYKIRV